ncbi:MAG: hypothetical protein QW597_03230 [Thermoplasmataceae archaeon]
MEKINKAGLKAASKSIKTAEKYEGKGKTNFAIEMRKLAGDQLLKIGQTEAANAQFNIAAKLSEERGEFVEREGELHQAAIYYEQAIKLMQKSGSGSDGGIERVKQKIIGISSVSPQGGNDEEKKRADLLKERTIARVSAAVVEHESSSEYNQRQYEINKELSSRHFSGIKGDKKISHNKALHEGIQVDQVDLDDAMLNYSKTADKATRHKEYIVAGNTYVRVYEMLVKNNDESRAQEFMHKAMAVFLEGGDYYFTKKRYDESARAFEHAATIHMKLGETDSARIVMRRAIECYMIEADNHLRKKMKKAAISPIERAIRVLEESGIPDDEKRNELLTLKTNMERDLN